MKNNSLNKVKLNFLLFVCILGIVIATRLFVFQISLVSGNSMLPTLKNGDLVLVSKIGFPISSEFYPWRFIYPNPFLVRLDIVIFEDQENEINLKRVVGMPGEYYEIKNGNMLIDSNILNEDYILEGHETKVPSNDIFFRFPDSPFLEMQKNGRIPPDYYLLLGDNRENSTDSRSMGLVPIHKLRGKVIGQYR